MYKLAKIVKFPNDEDLNTVVQIYKHHDTIKGHESNLAALIEDLPSLGYFIVCSTKRHLVLGRKLMIKGDDGRFY